MARIVNKNGKLTKRYREPGIFAPSRRGRKPSLWGSSSSKRRKSSRRSYSYSNMNYSNENFELDESTKKSLMGCLGTIIAFFLIIVFLIISLISGSNSNSNKSKPKDTSSIVSTAAITPDLSAYEGNPNISGNVYIEKEFDSWVIEVTGKCTNNTNKPIEKLKLYLICCKGADKPIDSNENANTITLENIDCGKTITFDRTSGTTTYGKKDFMIYVSYILYKDGSEWGKEEIDHSAIVTKNISIPLTFKEVEKASWKK